MTAFSYISALLISIAGMAVLDYRFSLAYFYDKKRTLLTVATAVAIFVVWDIIGIWLGIFHHGHSRFSLPFTIAPEFPVEEIFFLTLLCYCTLVIYRGVVKIWPRT